MIVQECKIQNDASIDISSDGTLIATLLPLSRTNNMTTISKKSYKFLKLYQTRTTY